MAACWCPIHGDGRTIGKRGALFTCAPRLFSGGPKAQSYNPRKKAGGEGGIRTPGTLRPSGFQDRRDRPLCHLSFNKLCNQAKELLSIH